MNLSPVRHDMNLSLFRVPVERQENLYVVYVDDMYNRIFNSDTLPDFIKVKLAMIHAMPMSDFPARWNSLEIFVRPYDGHNDTIGWRGSEMMYIVIMTGTELYSLKGGKHDTRSESKEESKGYP